VQFVFWGLLASGRSTSDWSCLCSAVCFLGAVSCKDVCLCVLCWMSVWEVNSLWVCVSVWEPQDGFGEYWRGCYAIVGHSRQYFCIFLQFWSTRSTNVTSEISHKFSSCKTCTWPYPKVPELSW
jgi:hypothetical protein